MSVMLMLIPRANISSIAGYPSSVAGILIIRLGRSTTLWKWATSSIVPSVS